MVVVLLLAVPTLTGTTYIGPHPSPIYVSILSLRLKYAANNQGISEKKTGVTYAHRTLAEVTASIVASFD